MDMQTGPARRGDTVTLRRHENLLKDDKDKREVYRVLTESILDMYGKK